MLLVGISIYLKSDLRYKFLILVTCHLDTIYKQGCEEPWLFFETERDMRAKKFLEH